MKMVQILVFASLVYALPGAALPPTDDSSEALNLGENVLSISRANRISDWEQIDAQHVVLSLSPDERYLLTLKHQCGGLRWAQNIGVTMSNNTIWAEFDAVTTDGLQCPIERINRVTFKQVDEPKI